MKNKSLKNAAVSSACLFLFLFTGTAFAEKPALPSSVIPDGLGYNIHFTHAKAGELEMLAGSGAKIIRMDFAWGGTEREKGKYDFSAFEHLTNDLEKHGIRPYYIFDYSNRHYDEGLSPYSEEGRKAFAKWAAAAAVHFKNRSIIWEMYNEPNIGFWKPKPKVDDYIALALEVGKALREAAPDELYIGAGTAQSPTLNTIDYPFLEECFKAGLLEYWDAISVHPYRQKAPETVAEEYAKLRHLIDKYAPKGKFIPIISGEWGYSSVWNNFNDEIQGKYLPRQWMFNLAFGVNTSIWYDWHDDGKDPKEAEHHFGTTNNEYKSGQTPVYEPKPSYTAAKTFIETFKGYQYNKRIYTDDDEVYVFLFSRGGFSPDTAGAGEKGIKLAAWTTSKEPKTITIPCSAGKFNAISYLGEKKEYSTADAKGLTLAVSDAPLYLTPVGYNPALQAFAYNTETNLPLAFYYDDNVPPVFSPLLFNMVVKNHEESRLWKGFRPNRFLEKTNFPIHTDTGGATNNGIVRFSQNITVYPLNPISLGLPFPSKSGLTMRAANPSGEALDDELISLRKAEGVEIEKSALPLSFKKGETEKTLVFPLKSIPKERYLFEVSSKDLVIFPLRSMRIVDDFSSFNNETLNQRWDILPDGDKNVGSEQKIETGNSLVKITYRFEDGWKFIRLTPKSDAAKIDGKPKALAVRIDGDGSGNRVNVRFRDSKGQTFQVGGGSLKEKLPYYFEFPLDGRDASHWGGANDGKIVYPIQLDSILIDGSRKACGPYSVSIASPVLIY